MKPPAEISDAEIPTAQGKDHNGRVAYTPQQIVDLLSLLPGYTWQVVAPDTNAAHAQRIALFLKDQLCYCSALGWLRYNGKHWEMDDKDNTRATDLVSTLSRFVASETAFLLQLGGTLARAERTEDADALARYAREHLKHAKNVEAVQFIASSLKLAANLLRVPWQNFQPCPWRVGFENGVWDRGEWREHRRDDYMLSISPVVYDPETDRTEWNAVLSRMTGDNADFARTLQELAGYCASGASHLRKIPWAYGPRGTGKSTYSELLATVLGDDASIIVPDDLNEKNRERTGAKIWDKRLAVCGEIGEQRVSAETIKQLSGADTLSVRLLYKESFDAKPRHVLIMASNDPPQMSAYDDALKDRIIVLPFLHDLATPEPFTLTGSTRIEAVRQMAGSPLVLGFTAWLLDGLLAVFQTEKIFVAQTVEDAITDFWKDTDPISDFWEVVSKDELKNGIVKTDLRRQYDIWAESEGVRRPLSIRQWKKACEAHGLEEYRGIGGTRFWRTAPEVAKKTPVIDKIDRIDTIISKPLCEKDSHIKKKSENLSILSNLSIKPTKPSVSTVRAPLQSTLTILRETFAAELEAKRVGVRLAIHDGRIVWVENGRATSVWAGGADGKPVKEGYGRKAIETWPWEAIETPYLVPAAFEDSEVEL